MSLRFRLAGSKKEAEALLVSLHANTAAAFLKLKRWADVVSSASMALDLDHANPKAMYRRGLAYKHLGQRTEAKRDLVQCAKLDPKNREIRDELSKLQNVHQQYKREERDLYGGIFAKAAAKGPGKWEAKTPQPKFNASGNAFGNVQLAQTAFGRKDDWR